MLLSRGSKFSSFLTPPTFHLHCLYQDGKTPASNAMKRASKQGGGKRMSEKPKALADRKGRRT